MIKMTKFLKRFRIYIYFLLAFIEGIIATLFLVQLPSETEYLFIFGLSLQRFALVLGNITLAFFFFFIAIYFWKHPGISKKLEVHLSQGKISSIVFLALNIVGTTFIILAFLLPEYRFSSYIGYFERLRPAIIWFALIYLQTNLLLISWRKFPKPYKYQPKRAVITFLTSFIAIWVFIASSGLGISPDDRYWNEAGVPLLNEQVFIALVISITFLFFSSRTKKTQGHPFLAFIHKKQDIFIFIILWIIAAIFWINEPLPHNFFAPGPYPPNNELCPYADSATFDIGGQFALIGQGLFNGGFYNRPLLSGFLALLHLIVGQNYLIVVALQTAIYASLAPILYLIGKELNSRTAGILISFFVILKNINAIASSTWILSVHSKYMLTEFPTAITLALFTLWFIRWQKKGGGEERYLILAGGALGLGIMLRTNILLFIPLALFLFLLKLKTNWKKLLQTTTILLLAFFFTISPWMWRSQKVASTPLFFLDIITEVIRTRYSLGVDDVPASHANLGMGIANQHLARRKAFPVNTLSRQFTQKKTNNHIQSDALVFIPNHFFHSIVTSVLTLPTSFTFHDLRHTIKNIYPYWNKINGQGWGGQLIWEAKIVLLWNLFLLSLGLGIAWKKWRVTGLLPLFVFLTYHISNAFARTSGGRYLVPVDWVTFLYYALGIVEIIFFITASLRLNICNDNKENKTQNKLHPFSYQPGILYILPFFLFVSMITILDQAIPARYPKLTSVQIQEKIIQGEFLKQTNISEQKLNTFLQEPDARIYFGRSLYPRFYTRGDGEHSTGRDAFEDKDFPRLTFTMIGQFGQTGVILPLNESPLYFPNAADLILVGCQHPTEGYLFPYIDAYKIILLGEEPEIIYTREPETSFQCPLPEPVCDGNRNCR
ncbi:MAG: hypothetical protein HOD49_00235 [Anaerolineae bacterium]|nr:hypothetical protein [Anaerolineae bacterium]